MPVDGTCSAAMPAHVRLVLAHPGLVQLVRLDAVGRAAPGQLGHAGAAPSGSVATTSLPVTRCGRSCSRQNATVSAQPATASRAFSPPGA